MEYQLINPDSSEGSIVEQILINRGITNIDHYLNTSDDDILSPDLIKNIEDGVKMLISHISQSHKIFIQVDSDCDGYTSAAALINYLNSLFPGFVQDHVIYRIHTGKQHGLIPSTIPDGVQLVIALDSSSNDFAEHEELKVTRGIDVLVIDHHEAEKLSEHACVINNQLCDYPTKSLSGVGMVYKFCSYIDSLMKTDHADSLLDLVSLGMIADMMDMRDFETKHLINRGLSQVVNPYFSRMTEKNSYSLGGELTPIGVAFYIAPYVNATVRVGNAEEKLLLFESMLNHLGDTQILSTKRGSKGQNETIAEQACRNCTNLKMKQAKARDSSLSAIEDIIEEKNLLENKLLVIQLEPKNAADKTLTGLIANQLMSRHQRPVLILNKVENKAEDGSTFISWDGSCRGPSKSKLVDLRMFLKETGLVVYAEGHSLACGVSILDENFDDFIALTNSRLADIDFEPSYKVDFIYRKEDLREADIIKVAELKSIWGQGVPEPFIAIEGIKITANNLFLMSPDKNPTLKITLPETSISLIKFRSGKEELDSLYTKLGCVTINVIGKCERNIWNGTVSPQIIIEDYEIVGRSEYYF